MSPEEQLVRARLAKVYTEPGVEVWLEGPRPWLGGRTPLEAVREGDSMLVLNVIDQMCEGMT